MIQPRLQPIVQAVSIISSTLLVELLGTRTNLVLQFTATLRLLEVCFDRHRGDYLGGFHFRFSPLDDLPSCLRLSFSQLREAIAARCPRATTPRVVEQDRCEPSYR